jgi:hypothetical protein
MKRRGRHWLPNDRSADRPEDEQTANEGTSTMAEASREIIKQPYLRYAGP